MESSHLVIFLTSGKFIKKINVLIWMSLSETLFWTGARGRIPITLTDYIQADILRITGVRNTVSIPCSTSSIVMTCLSPLTK